MSRLLHEIHTECNCMYFNWRTGITTISIITETIQLAIMYCCILILKCLKTHIENVSRVDDEDSNNKEETDYKQVPTNEALNELKGES